MSSSFRSFALVCVLLLLFSAVAAAQSNPREISVSKNLGLYNWSPSAAVCDTNADVLVVWEQWDRSGGEVSSIYAAMCSRRSNGKYKVRKAVCLSSKTDFNSEPGVAFNSSGKSYLVVWEKRDIVGGAITSSNIVGRKLNLKGKPVGPVFNITSSYDSDDEDVIITCIDPPANADFEHVIAWFHTPNFGEERLTESGIFTAGLSEDGKIKVGPRKVYSVKFSGTTIGYMSPESLVNGYVGACYLTVSYAVPGAGDESALIRLDAQAAAKGAVVLERKDGVYSRVAVLSKKLLQVGWYQYGSGNCYNQLFRTNLKKVKGQFQPFGKSTIRMDLISIQGGGAYEVASAGSQLYLSTYNKRGKKLSGPEVINPSSYVSLDFEAKNIRSHNEIIVLFGDDTNGNNVTSELKAIIFDVD